MARQRTNMQENWEQQRVVRAEEAAQQFIMAGGDAAFADAYKKTWLENNYLLKDSAPHPRMKPPTIRERILSRIAWMERMKKVRAQQARMMRKPTYGTSAQSFSTAPQEAEVPGSERNANRMAAPVGWEADAGQSRSAVMGMIGGRKTRR